MEAPVSVSIVIPAFNEAARLGPTLRTIVDWATGERLEYEIVVVDDGSTDDTCRVADEFGPPVRLVRNGTNRGKGWSVRHGVAESRGASILFTDADLSTPIGEYAKLAHALARAEVVIGSRALSESNIEKHQPWYRETMGRAFNRIVRALIVPGIKDTQCGFKLFRGPIARELFAEVTIAGFAFDVEVLYLARSRGYRIAEVPVTWLNDERSSVSAVRDSARMFRDVLRIRHRHAGRRPGRSE